MPPTTESGPRTFWRGPTTLQFGLDPAVAVAVADADAGSARLLASVAARPPAHTHRRHAARVVVRGATELATLTAELLRAAGVGSVADDGDPAGADVYLLVDALPGPSLARSLLRSPGAHLLLGADEVGGSVGPLTLPGRTACPRCLDLHRADRDPAWPLLAAQRGAGRPAGHTDPPVRAVLAGVAAQQVLELVDGGWPATCDGTLELRPPDWRVRRRSWPPHPECGCCWPPAEHGHPSH